MGSLANSDGLKALELRRLQRIEEKHSEKLRKCGKIYLRWPNLDMDLHIESIVSPECFPLIACQKTLIKIRFEELGVPQGSETLLLYIGKI